MPAYISPNDDEKYRHLPLPQVVPFRCLTIFGRIVKIKTTGNTGFSGREDSFMERNFIAFISYRHQKLDRAAAESIHSLIEEYIVPRKHRKDGKKLGIVYRDKDENRIGHDLDETLYKALDHSEYLIVICSKDTKNSKWVNAEIEYFLRGHAHDKILTVLLENMEDQDFPEALTRVTQADGTTKSVTPLGLDLSDIAMPRMRIVADNAEDETIKTSEWKKKAEHTALLQWMKRTIRPRIPKLYAALLDCSYDDLVQRQQRRKLHRVAAVFALALAVGSIYGAMLLSKNADLAQQRNEVLLRESELLTQNARQSLDDGDSMAAIRNSLSALPSDENQRPYYGPAEAALIDALDLFEPDSGGLLIDQLRIDQGTPISDFLISKDGTRIFTVDYYHTVRCFDTSSTQLLWSSQIENQQWWSVQLAAIDEVNMVLVYSLSYCAILDMDTGECASLTTDLAYDCVRSVENDEKSIAVYLDSQVDETEEQVHYSLMLIDCDPFRIANIPVATGDYISDDHSITRSVFMVWDYSLDRFAGAISDEGDFFAGYYCSWDENDEMWTHYFLADLANNSARTVYSKSNENEDYNTVTVRHIGFADNGSSLLTAEFYWHDQSVLVTKVDIQSGTVIWQKTLPSKSETSDRYTYEAVRTLQLRDQLLVLIEKEVFLVDITTGALLDNLELPDAVDSLLSAGDQSCAMIMEDGTYMLGWTDEGKFRYSGTFANGMIHTGTSIRRRIWNGGFLRFDAAASAMTYADGFLATLDAGGNDSISITRILRSGNPIPKRTVYSLQADERFRETTSMICSGNMLAFGSVESISDDSLRFELIDRNTLESVGRISRAPASILNNPCYVLPDASGMIYSIDGQNIIAYDDETGENRVLSGEVSEEGMGGWFVYQAGSRVLTETGDILSVYFDFEANTMDVWINGADGKTIQLPRLVNWWHPTKTGSTTIGDFGSNGYLVMGGNVLPGIFGNEKITRFGICDLISGKWSQFRCDPIDAPNVGIAVGKSSPRFAVLNAEGFKIFDISRRKEYSAASYPFQIEDIMQAELVADDNYLLLYTLSNQVFIFDITTGEMVYSEILPANPDSIVIQEDTADNRLFILYKDHESYAQCGICIDTRTWTQLAHIPGMLLQDPATDQVFMAHREDGQIVRIDSVWMPGMLELAEHCRALFHLD